MNAVKYVFLWCAVEVVYRVEWFPLCCHMLLALSWNAMVPVVNDLWGMGMVGVVGNLWEKAKVVQANLLL